MNSEQVTFTVSRTKKPDTLEHCFIVHMVIDLDNPPPVIRANNGELYQAKYDNFIAPPQSKQAKAIISCQRHTFGNFAVIRNYTPKVGVPNGH